jgi:phosphatidylinositol kinase/protein kinase (PI-3  family)
MFAALHPHTLQMISLMDNLLKRENLDLRLTPYTVLPTGEAAAAAHWLVLQAVIFMSCT